MKNKMEYIKIFMEYESDDMPMVYFYEVDLNDHRFALRAMEVFVNRTVKLYNNLYDDVIEAVPIPTEDELNSNVWGKGFHAFVISQDEFERVWESGIYNGDLFAT